VEGKREEIHAQLDVCKIFCGPSEVGIANLPTRQQKLFILSRSHIIHTMQARGAAQTLKTTQERSVMSPTGRALAPGRPEATGSGGSAQQRSQAFKDNAQQVHGFPSWRTDHQSQTDPTLSCSNREVPPGIFPRISNSHSPVPPQSVLPSNAPRPAKTYSSASRVTPKIEQLAEYHNNPASTTRAGDNYPRPGLHGPLPIRSLLDPANVRPQRSAPPVGHWNPVSPSCPGGTRPGAHAGRRLKYRITTQLRFLPVRMASTRSRSRRWRDTRRPVPPFTLPRPQSRTP